MSCQSSKTYKDAELEQILQERYGERFVVRKNHFHFSLNSCQFEAVLRDNREIEIQGSYHRRDHPVRDNYPQMLNSHQAEQVLRELLSAHYDRFAVSANAMSKFQEEQGREIPPFLEMISTEEGEPRVLFRIYLFDTIARQGPSYLEGLVQTANFFAGSYHGGFTFQVHFWKPEFLQGKNLSRLDFGFHAGGGRDDPPQVKAQYIEEELYFEFEAAQTQAITREELEEQLQPFTRYDNWQR